MDIIPMVLNGAIGADLHVNFAVASRSSFGFYLSRVAVVIRMITALFWHGMLSYVSTFLRLPHGSPSLKLSRPTPDRLP